MARGATWRHFDLVENDVTFSTLMKRPSAFLPVAMSACALALVIGFVAMYGIVQQEDEGVAARIFQLLLAAQLPIMAFFALVWLPRAPKRAVLVLLLQAGAAFAALLLVILLDL